MQRGFLFMAQTPNYYIGKDGFVWWIGVVEDRNDPIQLGRVRVRVYGYHTQDKIKLPTIDLPWAYSIQPMNSATSGGIGSSPTGPIEGTWVVGFWRDPDFYQEPMVFGTLPGVTPANAVPQGQSPYTFDPAQRVPQSEPVTTTTTANGTQTAFTTPADTTDATVLVKVNGVVQTPTNIAPSSPNNVELTESDYSGGTTYTANDFSQSRFASNIASKINQLAPQVRTRFANGVKKFLADNRPELDCNIAFSYRSLGQQQELRSRWEANNSVGYAARPGYSWHNYGSAIDLTIYYDNGQTYDDGRTGVSRYTQTARAAFAPSGLVNEIENDSGHFYPSAFGKTPPDNLRSGSITLAELATEKGIA
jgi:LAS superfamily LD-carboxypeptidase LdcB